MTAEETKARVIKFLIDVRYLVEWNAEDYPGVEEIELAKELEFLIKELNK